MLHRAIHASDLAATLILLLLLSTTLGICTQIRPPYPSIAAGIELVRRTCDREVLDVSPSYFETITIEIDDPDAECQCMVKSCSWGKAENQSLLRWRVRREST